MLILYTYMIVLFNDIFINKKKKKKKKKREKKIFELMR